MSPIRPARARNLTAAILAVLLVSVGVTVSILARDSTDPAPDSVGWVDSSRGGVAVPPARGLPAPVPRPDPSGVFDPSAEVSVDVDGFLAWAARDLTTGVTVASPNAGRETSSTESMIKVWIVADYLRRLARDGQEPSDRDLRDASRAIRDSHNGAAERLYVAGGRDAVVQRMIDVCDLTDTFTPAGDEGWWSRTEISARDAARLGECVVDGRAAGPEWTDWLLEEMRQVRGTTHTRDQRPAEGFEGGRWGIIDGLPAHTAEDAVAIKNGWTRIGRTNSWHVNCLAVTDEWVMAVLLRYPADYPLDYGAERCAAVAEQLLAQLPEPVSLAVGAHREVW